MGVWIEITIVGSCIIGFIVTPCVGVWIEMSNIVINPTVPWVTPCVGVWIEIRMRLILFKSS